MALYIRIQLHIRMHHYIHVYSITYTYTTYESEVNRKQLIANDKGAFQSIGLDSVAGLVVVATGLVFRKLAGTP